MSRASLPLLLSALVLAGCASGSTASGGGGLPSVGPSGAAAGVSLGPGADTRTDLATQASCRARVNEMYDRRNRADIYQPNSSINTPFSANYQPGTTDRGLADQFSYDGTIRECLRNAGAGSGAGATGAGGTGGTLSAPPSTRGF